MSDINQTDRDRADHIFEQATLDIENGNQGGTEWLAAILSVYRDED